MSLILSVCMSVCPSVTNITSSFLFWNRAVLWPRVLHDENYKRCSSIFDLGPLTPKIYSPKFGTKSPESRLVWQIYRRCLDLPGGFRGWPIQWNHAKWCGPTLVAKATKFGLGVESSRLPVCLSVCFSSQLFCFSDIHCWRESGLLSE